MIMIYDIYYTYTVYYILYIVYTVCTAYESTHMCFLILFWSKFCDPRFCSQGNAQERHDPIRLRDHQGDATGEFQAMLLFNLMSQATKTRNFLCFL